MLKGYRVGMIMSMHPAYESTKPDVEVGLVPVDGETCLVKYRWPYALPLDVECIYRSSDSRITLDLIPLDEANDLMRGWESIV